MMKTGNSSQKFQLILYFFFILNAFHFIFNTVATFTHVQELYGCISFFVFNM